VDRNPKLNTVRRTHFAARIFGQILAEQLNVLKAKRLEGQQRKTL
jgi:hypothetical protein